MEKNPSTVVDLSPGNPTILIVDDQPDNLRLLSKLLTEHGYDVRPALTGGMALEALKHHQPDLILLDIRMPEMDGYEVCRRLKADARTRHVPVIFISALEETADKIKGFGAGAVDYITKPFQHEEVLARVKAHVALRRMRRRIEEQNERLQQEIIEREKVEREIQRRAEADRLMSIISKGLLDEEIDSAIQWGLEALGRFLHVDRSYLFIYDDAGKIFSNTHEWGASDIESFIHERRSFAASDLPWFSDRILKGRIVAASSVEDLPPEASSFRKLLKRQSVRSIIFIPIFHRGVVRGAIGVDSVQRGREWAAEETELLKRFGDSFAIALARQEAEKTQRENEKRIRKIFDSVNTGIIVIDPDSRRLVDANPVAVKMIGSDREDIIGNICHEFFATMETQCPILNLGQDMDNSERELLSRDGRRIPVLKTVVSVMLGGKAHLIESFVDLTERKNMEEALRQAKEAAEAATAARAMFLANMSHEIRTPLNAIMGFAHLTIKTLLTDEQREYLTKIQNASKSLLEIVNEILDFSKIDAGKIYVEEKDFRIENILEELADLFADQVAEKGFEMNIICEPDVPATLIGDQLRIKQILINLMSNAVKFTPAGEIFMGVSCLKKTDDTVFVSFMVKDTGIGIAREKHETIFSAFTQVDGSTTRTYAGTGLGLAISRRLAALMGGEIRVESEEEKGSTFTFTLPLKSRQGKVKHPYRDSDLHGFRALVVDDNENSRKVFSKMTKSFGIAVQAAASGEEALAMLKGAAHAGNPYHLALVDMQLPGLDGLDVSRKIRSDARLAGMPIIMISGFATDRDIQNGLSIGVSGFLLKPVKCSVLFETVLEALGKKSGSKTDGLEQALKTDRTWTPLFPGARVLLAEDDSVNQEVVVKLLGMEGIVVDIVENGAKAVEAFRRRSYEAVLMDIQMPELDGYEATRCIRALELEAQGFQGEEDRQPSARPKRVPIVAMTAHAMQGDRNKCLEVGMDGYVSKPIDPDRLVSALKRWMDPSATKDRPMPALHCERLSSFPALDGLDAKAGLRRLRGDTALYGNLLKNFSLKASARIDAIKDALVAHDTEKAMTLVHGLKGVAGNLSAWKLHLAATDLETALRTGKGDQGIPSSRILTKFGAMEDALAGTLGSIRDCEKFLEREAGHADDKEVEEIMGAKEVRSMLVQFSEHLAAKHVAVQDLMPRVARCLRARGVDREIKQLRAKVDMFDFDGAQEILKSVVEILGISL